MEEKRYNYQLIVAYEGTRYFGWQEVGTHPTIEGALQRALTQILSFTPQLQGASRTDRGVHATGQVANFFSSRPLDVHRLKLGLNALTPPDISILKLSEVPLSFHPTLDACGKEYHYELCTGPTQQPRHRHFSWHIPTPLHIFKMREAASHFMGEKDFRSFCNQRKQIQYPHYIRKVTALDILPLTEDRLLFRVRGNAFLYKMVRNLVGTLVDVGRGKIAAETLPLLLSQKTRSSAGVTAPAHGLTLAKVEYSTP